MHILLIRHILLSFVIVAGGFVLACLVALSSLERVAAQLQMQLTVVPITLELIRSSQIFILGIGLASFLAGLVGMAFAAHQAACIIDRLRQATRYLGDVVLDEMTPAEFLSASDGLDREIQEMMLKIKDSQKRCLDASPLTRLPGNMAIEEVLKDKMERGEKFALCYIDLDDFKAFNDKYGYARGSELIKMTGEIVYRAKDKYADSQDFVGHIGGDDFVLVTSPNTVEEVCRSIVDDFDQRITGYYHPEDRDKGYIEGLDRYGVLRRFPIMSISIAVVSDVMRTFKSPVEIAKVATELKDYAKSLPGSNYLIDRRATSRWEHES